MLYSTVLVYFLHTALPQAVFRGPTFKGRRTSPIINVKRTKMHRFHAGTSPELQLINLIIFYVTIQENTDLTDYFNVPEFCT